MTDTKRDEQRDGLIDGFDLLVAFHPKEYFHIEFLDKCITYSQMFNFKIQVKTQVCSMSDILAIKLHPIEMQAKY